MPNTLSLAGRSALITGAAKRLGAGIARALHAEGANVVIHHHGSAAQARELANALNAARASSASLLRADLLEVARLPDLIAHTVATFGGLDILVNNASSFYPTPLGSITLAQWDDLFGTNLRAPLFLTQAAAPHLRERRGLVINMVDIHAQRPLAKHPVYCAAKAGLVMLTRSLARELGPEVRVNGIAPGPVLWPESGADESLKSEIIGKTALKRMGAPDDIGRAVLFFAKDAPYVTGQILAIDGGRSIGW